MVITLINLTVIAFLLYTIATQIDWYNRIIFTKYRLRYFALRDKLALLVLNGAIKEDSWEYKHIIAAINHHIRTVETMSINYVVKILSEYHTSSDEQRNQKFYERRVDNREVLEVIVEYLDITRELLKRNSRCQLQLLSILKKFIKPKQTTVQHYAQTIQPKRAIEELKEFGTRLENRLHSFAA